jgi:chromosome segregation protein
MESPLSVPPGSLPPPSHWLKVPPELETAVAAIIGEMLSAPILPDTSHLSAAFAELAQKSGWLLWSSPSTRKPSPPAGFSRLIDSIQYPAEYGNLLESILGNVLLLADVTSETITVLGDDWVGVTRQGIVVNRYSMGYPQAAQLAPELNLRRLLAEAQKTLAEKESVLADITKELAEVTEQENKQREDVSSRNLAWQEAQTHLREAQAKAQESIELLRRLQTRLTDITAELSPLADEKEKLGGEQQEISAQQSALEAAIASLAAQETAVRSALKELEQQRESLWQQVLDSRSTESQAGDGLNSVKRQLLWVQEQQTKLNDRNKALEEESAKATAEMEKVTAELAELRKTIKNKSAEQEKLADAMRRAEEAVSQARSVAATCDDSARQHREAHRVLQESTGELKALLLLAEAEWANLRDRAREAGIEATPAMVKAQEMPPEASLEKLEEECDRAKASLASMGEINYMAEEEFNAEEERNKFLSEQVKDLEEAEGNLLSTISALDRNSREVLLTTLEHVNINFQNIFGRLFEGGEAALLLPQGEDPITGNLEIIARPPGKRTRHINLLSGGEKALSAIALLFALFMERPSPFCILDEIDAPLDDANVQRFLSLLSDFSQNTQFLIITHNKRTMEAADSLVGITMGEPGVSSVISLKLADVDKVMEPDQ